MLLHAFTWHVIFCCQFLNIFQGAQASNTHALNWSTSVSNSPIVSSPLLLKSCGEKYSDRLIVTTFDGSVTVINTASGSQESPWPLHFTEKAFYAGPLLYDINQDGLMDILLTASDGEIMFLNQNGTHLTSETITLPLLLVKRKWNTIQLSTIINEEPDSERNQIKNSCFISLEEFEEKYHSDLATLYLPVETHILSTPVIGDFNGDGFNSELIVPVNYYFDEEIKQDLPRLKNLSIDGSEVDLYLASGLVVIDLETKQTIFNVILELTMKSSNFAGYLLSSPVVVDLDGVNGDPEVLIGSMSGQVHAYNKHGPCPWKFERSDPIHGEIAVGDVNGDGHLEVIGVDSSGNVFCYGNQKLLWEATVSGTMTAGAQLVDINGDGISEVIIATNDGYLWIFDGLKGHILPNWPLKVGEQINSKLLIRKHSDNSIDIVALADEDVHIIDMKNRMHTVIPINTSSYVPAIFDYEHRSAFIVSTTEGNLLAFGNQYETNFASNQETGVRFAEKTVSNNIITTSTFIVWFEIYDKLANKAQYYNVTVTFPTENSIGYHTYSYEKPGLYSVTLKTPPCPKRSYVSLELCNRFKECTKDITHFVFYPKAKDNLVLYVILPFVVMVFLLLILHGYPEGDLLPIWAKSYND